MLSRTTGVHCDENNYLKFAQLTGWSDDGKPGRKPDFRYTRALMNGLPEACVPDGLRGYGGYHNVSFYFDVYGPVEQQLGRSN